METNKKISLAVNTIKQNSANFSLLKLYFKLKKNNCPRAERVVLFLKENGFICKENGKYHFATVFPIYHKKFDKI